MNETLVQKGSEKIGRIPKGPRSPGDTKFLLLFPFGGARVPITMMMRPRGLPLLLLVLVSRSGLSSALDPCPVGCSSHGRCMDGFCVCVPGWAGQDCSFYLTSSEEEEEDGLEEKQLILGEKRQGLSNIVEHQCAADCGAGGGGRCVAGACVCSPGFFGPSCADQSCSNDCWGHGKCHLGKCGCGAGWTGRSCELKLDASQMCDPACQNGARCVNGACSCAPGFGGVDCSLQQEESESASPSSSFNKASLSEPAGRSQAEMIEMNYNSTATPRSSQASTTLGSGFGSAATLLLQSLPTSDLEELGRQLHGKKERGKRRQDDEDAGKIVDEAALSRAKEALQRALSAEAERESRTSAAEGHRMNLLRTAARASDLTRKVALRLRKVAQAENLRAAASQMEMARTRALANANQIPGHEFARPDHQADKEKRKSSLDVDSTSMGKKQNREGGGGVGRGAGDGLVPSSPIDNSGWSQKNAMLLGDKGRLASSEPQQEEEQPQQEQQQQNGCEKSCSGHGTCSADGSCDCEEAWVGAVCDTPRCPYDCNGQGMCLAEKCVCEADFYGDACQHMRCPEDCSGHGYCFQGSCQCKEGYEGEKCTIASQPHGVFLTMSLEESPSPTSRASAAGVFTLRGESGLPCPAKCNGHGTCAREGKCECHTGYSGHSCEAFCPNECSKSGDCVEGACLCYAGFLGPDCSAKACCSGHGTCPSTETNTSASSSGSCSCDPGWGGEECSTRVLCADPNCRGHGTCNAGKCECVDGWMGLVCAEHTSGCTPPCSSHGQCHADSRTCECEDGFTGPTCSLQIKKCETACNGHGLCFDGACVCEPTYSGEDCTVKDGTAPSGDGGPMHGYFSSHKGGGPDLSSTDVSLVQEREPPSKEGNRDVVMNAPAPAPASAADPAAPLEATRRPAFIILRSCVSNCNGHGLCFDGECTCSEGFSGQDCAVPEHQEQLNASSTSASTRRIIGLLQEAEQGDGADVVVGAKAPPPATAYHHPSHHRHHETYLLQNLEEVFQKVRRRRPAKTHSSMRSSRSGSSGSPTGASVVAPVIASQGEGDATGTTSLKFGAAALHAADAAAQEEKAGLEKEDGAAALVALEPPPKSSPRVPKISKPLETLVWIKEHEKPARLHLEKAVVELPGGS